MKKKVLYGIALVLLFGLAGSGTAAAIMKSQKSEKTAPSAETSASETDTAEEIPIQTETLLQDMPAYPAEPLELPEMHHQDTVMMVEAEHAEFTEPAQTAENDKCSNGQCLSDFQKTASVRAAFMLPSAQHYDITVSVQPKQPCNSTLCLNGETIGTFQLSDTEHFTRITFSAVFLPEGEADISLKETEGIFSIDYFEISNHTELQNIKYQNLHTLSDENASPNAQKLMQFLNENYGKSILTGQYVSSAENAELHAAAGITGKYPAIRFAECKDLSEMPSVVRSCEEWALHGGINAFTWYWNAPEDNRFYADETSFFLSSAVPAPEIDAALLSDEEIQNALTQKKISDSCAALLKDIDTLSEQLKPFSEKDIPVLWRPLPEAGGGWYWWGADGAEAYLWLWDVLYRRMTEYHQLHNLIWIWNGQNQDYLVSSSQYDIASMDIYLSPEHAFDSRYEEFLTLYRMTGHQKLLALSECGALPDVNLMFRDNTVWSFMGLFCENSLYDMNSETFIHFYHSEKVLTLDDVKTILK